MESKVPLPTDNIYKFYALFGLLLFIFAIGANIVSIRNTNDYMYKSYLELEPLKSIEKPTNVELVKREMLEKMIDVAKSDKEFFSKCLSWLTAIGAVLMFFGFLKWQLAIQPLQDDLLRLQVAKLRHEVASLQPAPQPHEPPPAVATAEAAKSR